MNVSDYEVIDNLDRTISSISRDESIDRVAAFKALQERLTYQLRRVDVFLTIGWVNGFEPINRQEPQL